MSIKRLSSFFNFLLHSIHFVNCLISWHFATVSHLSFEPIMLKRLFCCNSILRIACQQFLQQINSRIAEFILWDSLPELILRVFISNNIHSIFGFFKIRVGFHSERAIYFKDSIQLINIRISLKNCS